MFVRLENRTPPHLKFYEMLVHNTDVHIKWGRIGTLGQTQIVNHADRSLAEAFFNQKKEEKLDRGYVVVSQHGAVLESGRSNSYYDSLVVRARASPEVTAVMATTTASQLAEQTQQRVRERLARAEADRIASLQRDRELASRLARAEARIEADRAADRAFQHAEAEKPRRVNISEYVRGKV